MARNEVREEGNGRKEKGQPRGEERQGSGIARSEGGGVTSGGYGIVGTGPFSFARRMLEDMDRLFGELGIGGALTPLRQEMPMLERGFGTWSPSLEVFEDGNSLVVRADVPGLEPDDVSIELQNDMLVISGERREEKRDEREGFFRTERSYGRFERAIRVPEGTDASSCEAKLDNGVLEVRLALPEQRQRGRRIPIQTSGETVSQKPASSKTSS